MENIQRIVERKDILEYLGKRNLIAQYQKAKCYLLSGYLKQVNFKIRHPKGSGIFSFRINKQYRALGIIVRHELHIFKIDDHQRS